MEPNELIVTKEKEFHGLWERMDGDADLIDNVAYKFKDFDGKPEPRMFSVTIPNGALFFAKMVALISSVSRQPVIESEELNDDDKAYVIDFIQDMDFEIDALLNNKGEGAAFTTHAGYLCGRGWSVEQHLSRAGEDGKFLADVRPIDPRWFTFETDMHGMRWGCVESVGSKAGIEEEFNKTISGDTAIIKDFWDDKVEQIYIGGEQEDERPNPYGYPPFVVQAVPFGAGMLKTKDATKRTGESIFYPHRDMFGELNFMASILKTQSYDDLRGGLQQPGDKAAKTPEDYPTSKSIIPVDEPLLLVPRRDMTVAMKTYQGIINNILQRSGLSDIDEGTLAFPLSAVALAKLMAAKDSLTLPRLHAMSLLYRARTKMIINQAQLFGTTIEIGQEGMKRKYETGKLDGAYTIDWHYFSDTLEDRAAKAAIGSSMRGQVSMDFIRKEILRLENPDAEEDAIEVEEAKRTEPLITLLERIHSLIDEDTGISNTEAWILHHRLTTILKQRVIQGIPETEAPPPLKPTQQLPVFGGKGGQAPAGGEV